MTHLFELELKRLCTTKWPPIFLSPLEAAVCCNKPPLTTKRKLLLENIEERINIFWQVVRCTNNMTSLFFGKGLQEICDCTSVLEGLHTSRRFRSCLDIQVQGLGGDIF